MNLICAILACDETGYFIQPTVLLTKDSHSPTMITELFGPVVTIYTYPADEFEETVCLVEFKILI